MLSSTIEGAIEIATQPRAIDHETNYTGSEDIDWFLLRSAMMLPIRGTSSNEHLGQDVAATSLRLTVEDYQTLSGV